MAVRKDLDIISLFLSKVGYKRAIYLVYGEDARMIHKILALAREIKIRSPIELWFHHRPGEAARHVEMIGD
jgi:hypothetical protein